MQQNQQSERKPLILSVQHLEVLENFISEIPTKYGVTLLNFFAEVTKQQVEEEVVETTEE